MHSLSRILPLSLTLLLGFSALSAQPKTPASPGSVKPKVTNPLEGSIERVDLGEAAKLADEKPAQPAESSAGPGAADFPQVFRQRALVMFDRNKDGRLDDDERAEAQKFARERGLGDGPDMRKDILKRFDQNKNGRLDDDERSAVEDFFRQRGAATARPVPRETNDRAALEKMLRAAVEADAAQLRRFDDDKDGRLNDGEWAAVRLELTERAAEPTPPRRKKVQ